MLLRIAAALAVLIALPAAAPAVLIALPAAAPGDQPCGDQTTTMDIAACLQARTTVLDQRLNAAYKTLAQRIDAGQREPLKVAQRLWIQYRDANCRFYGSQEGSIRQIQGAECMRAMTEERAIELEKAMKFD